MAREFTRSDRVADAVQRLLAQMIPAEIRDPRVGMVNVNSVDVARDLSIAKVYVTVVGAEKEGLTALDVIPVHFLFSAAKSATGQANMNVTAQIETRITDSMTGELIGAGKSVLTGEQLKNSKQQIKLENVQESLDTAANDGAQLLSDFK